MISDIQLFKCQGHQGCDRTGPDNCYSFGPSNEMNPLVCRYDPVLKTIWKPSKDFQITKNPDPVYKMDIKYSEMSKKYVDVLHKLYQWEGAVSIQDESETEYFIYIEDEQDVYAVPRSWIKKQSIAPSLPLTREKMLESRLDVLVKYIHGALREHKKIDVEEINIIAYQSDQQPDPDPYQLERRISDIIAYIEDNNFSQKHLQAIQQIVNPLEEVGPGFHLGYKKLRD